jgi:hypothetical protein
VGNARFLGRDPVSKTDYQEAQKIIKSAREVTTTYSKLHKQYVAALEARELEEGNPFITASLLSVEAMFEDFTVGRYVGLEAMMVLAARCSTRYPELRDVFAAYCHLIREGIPSSEISLPALCETVSLDAAEFAGMIVSAAIWYGQDVAKLKVSQCLSEVVESVRVNAKIPGREGHADRRLMFELAGAIGKEGEGGKNAPVININNNQKVGVVQPGGLPEWNPSAVHDVLTQQDKSED